MGKQHRLNGEPKGLRRIRNVAAVAVLMATMSVSAVLAVQPSARAQEATWLDAAQPENWNVAGTTIPAAPAPEYPVEPRALAETRAPESDEEQALVEAGWHLVGPFEAGWGVRLVVASATFDGMGRPWQYQGFVFVDGRLAGTLSPTTMNSRFDGAMGEMRLTAGDSIEAEYRRYGPDDALCCPTRTTTVEFKLRHEVAGPLVVPVSATTVANQPEETPPPTPPLLAGSLVGGVWQWQETLLNDGTRFVPEDPNAYTLEFRDDGTVGVRADCNRGGGQYTVDGSRIEITGLFSTRVACPPGSLEQPFMMQVEQVASYSFIGADLVLELPFDSGTMRFLRAISSSN